MLIGPDTKVLVVHRRLFETDEARFFVGRVEGYEAGVAKIRGWTFTRDHYGEIVKKADERIKVLSLSSGTLIVYQLPLDTEIEKLEIRSHAGRVRLSDGRKVEMDLTETPQR